MNLPPFSCITDTPSTTGLGLELGVVVCKILEKLPDAVEFLDAFNTVFLTMTDVRAIVSLKRTRMSIQSTWLLNDHELPSGDITKALSRP